MFKEAKKNFLIELAFFVTVAVLIYLAFKFLSVYMFPFLIGILLTALMQRPAAFVSKKTKIKKGICAMILVLLSFSLVITLLIFLGYFLCSQGMRLVNSLPNILQDFSGLISSVSDSMNEIFINMPDGMQGTVEEIFNNLITTLGSSVTKWASSFAASVALNAPEFIVAAIVTVVASCYIAKDFDKFKAFIRKWLKPKHLQIIVDIRDVTFKNVFKLLKSYIIIMLITFFELSVGLIVLGVNNGIFIAALISIVDILPVLGSGTVLIPWGIISLLQGNYFLGIGLIVLYVIILIIRNIIEPKIIGDQVGLHPLITLVMIFIGLRLFGVIGMFILPIIAIVIYHLLRQGKLDFLFAKE